MLVPSGWCLVIRCNCLELVPFFHAFSHSLLLAPLIILFLADLRSLWWNWWSRDAVAFGVFAAIVFIAASFAASSAFSLPTMSMCPGIHTKDILTFSRDSKLSKVSRIMDLSGLFVWFRRCFDSRLALGVDDTLCVRCVWSAWHFDNVYGHVDGEEFCRIDVEFSFWSQVLFDGLGEFRAVCCCTDLVFDSWSVRVDTESMWIVGCFVMVLLCSLFVRTDHDRMGWCPPGGAYEWMNCLKGLGVVWEWLREVFEICDERSAFGFDGSFDIGICWVSLR